MDAVAELELDASVSTTGTNWKFIGKDTHPSWRNSKTGHTLLIDEVESDDLIYQVRLNHPSQPLPWWTVSEVEFPAELIPLVEWVLSAPDDVLFTQELVVAIPVPFWNAYHSDDSSTRTA